VAESYRKRRSQTHLLAPDRSGVSWLDVSNAVSSLEKRDFI
jgi:hypothetical protein